MTTISGTSAARVKVEAPSMLQRSSTPRSWRGGGASYQRQKHFKIYETLADLSGLQLTHFLKAQSRSTPGRDAIAQLHVGLGAVATWKVFGPFAGAPIQKDLSPNPLLHLRNCLWRALLGASETQRASPVTLHLGPRAQLPQGGAKWAYPPLRMRRRMSKAHLRSGIGAGCPRVRGSLRLMAEGGA